MKTSLIILLAVILGLAGGMGTAVMRIMRTPWDGDPGGKAVDAPLPDLPAAGELLPKLVVQQTDYDFGTMDLGDEGSHDFVFANRGPGRLVLGRGSSTCSCMVAEFEEDEITVLPGGSVSITVKWTTDEKTGEYQQTAQITSNDPALRKVELVISGKISEAVKAVPAEVSFGRISAGEAATRTVAIYHYLDQPPLQLLGHSWARNSIADHFEVGFSPMPADQLQQEPDAKSGQLLSITLKPGLPLGVVRQTIFLRTNLETATVVEVPITGTIGRDIAIAGRGWNDETGILDIGPVGRQEGALRKLILIARGPQHKQVQFTAGPRDPEMLQVELGERTELANGKATQTTLVIRIAKGSGHARYLGSEENGFGQIVILTTHPEIPELRLRVSFAIVD